MVFSFNKRTDGRTEERQMKFVKTSAPTRLMPGYYASEHGESAQIKKENK